MRLQMDYSEELFHAISELNTVKTKYENTLTQLRHYDQKNKDLQEQIERLAIENSNIELQLRKKHIVNEEYKQRWQFYRANKIVVKQELIERSTAKQKDVPWFVVKKATDHMFYQHKKDASVNICGNIK